MTDIPFVVRPLNNNVLKAAFRLHLTPEALQHLHLKVGDICALTSEDGTHGAALAWRAADKMGSSPKVQPAKMSETLCDTFGFKQGNQVRIERSQITSVQLASKVNLIEVTPEDWERPDDNQWKIRCLSTLAACEAIAVGMSFDVNSTERLKKRYYIEHIDLDNTQEVPSLYRIDDTTDLRILDCARSPSVVATVQRPFHVEATHIGGLAHQLDLLNRRLKVLCMKAKLANRSKACNQGILIHGYEGTGKTMLLDALARTSGLAKVLRLTKSDLSGTVTKSQTLISSVFQQAQSSQPSLILIDELDEIAPNGDDVAASLVQALGTAMDSVTGQEVLVVAASRSLHKVNAKLMSSGRLSADIELPVPDLRGRVDILTSLLRNSLEPQTVNSIAAATHGYTGHDLARLADESFYLACSRLIDDQESWQHLDSTNASRPMTSESADGRSGSVATTLIDTPSSPEIVISQADLETALKTIRPSALREVIIEPPNISFADIGGSETLHAKFDEIIEWPTKYAHLYTGPLKSRRGILFYGPPGCSKTMTAQAVAKTYGWNFIAIRGAELISMYVGESERALREIFRKARQAAPAIVFFDEIDSIAASRSSSSDSSKGLNVLTTLLNEMDGFEALKNVLVLAATNRPEILDPAILRPGRFDEHIYLGPPDADARQSIMAICAKDRSTDVRFAPLVEASKGMSGAEITNAWQLAHGAALKRAITHNQTLKISTEDVLRGILETPKGINEEMLAGYKTFATRGSTLNA